MSGNDNKHTFRIGLTGGIASGKSTVADMFADLGIAVIDTDVIAREIVQPGEPALQEIRERFGEAVIDASKQLDRAAMRKLVFSDAKARVALENILHPRIGIETRRQSAAANGPYQLVVVPLLVGSELLHFVDRILVIDCEEETQIQRLMSRDAETAEGARKILSAQASREARLAIADDVIQSEQTLDELRNRVKALDETYRLLAQHSCPRGQSPESS